jgi:hypothetical protein
MERNTETYAVCSSVLLISLNGSSGPSGSVQSGLSANDTLSWSSSAGTHLASNLGDGIPVLISHVGCRVRSVEGRDAIGWSRKWKLTNAAQRLKQMTLFEGMVKGWRRLFAVKVGSPPLLRSRNGDPECSVRPLKRVTARPLLPLFGVANLRTEPHSMPLAQPCHWKSLF